MIFAINTKERGNSETKEQVIRYSGFPFFRKGKAYEQHQTNLSSFKSKRYS